MPSLTLTDRSIRRKPPATGTLELWDTIVPGLALRIHAGGRRSYCVTTRLATTGKQIRRTLGTTATHSIREAREAARGVIHDAARGIDSGSKAVQREGVRQAQVAAERAEANSFRTVVESYLADTGKFGAARLRSRKLIAQSLDKHAMAKFGDRPVGDIRREEVRTLLRGMIAAGKPIAANRLLSYLKVVFRWAVEEDKIESSPIVDLAKPADETSRARILDAAELAEIWHACGKLSKADGGAIRLMLLSGTRRNEAAGLLHSELSDDGETWNLPAARSKNGRPHIVPLAELAREVIEGVPQVDGGDPVFSLDGKRAINGWSKTKARLDRIIGQARAEAAGEQFDAEKHAMPHWTFHDLRRSLVTGMIEDLGIAPHVVEAVVNHVSGASRAGVAGIYNRSVLLPQRREALQAWSRHIESIIAGEAAPSNVTPIGRAE
jgi:integrase